MSETIAALTAAVEAAPQNTLLPLVLADALDEAGETAAAMTHRIRSVVDAKTKRSSRIRTMIRDEVGMGRNGHCAVAVVDGDAAPVLSGRSWYHTTATGVEVRYPNAYKKVAKSAELIYVPASYVVTVGAEWVAARI